MGNNLENNYVVEDKESNTRKLFRLLMKGHNEKSIAELYGNFCDYIKRHKRIMYSAISEEIYKMEKNEDKTEEMYTLILENIN